MPRTVVIESNLEFVERHGGNPVRWDWGHKPLTVKAVQLLPTGAMLKPNMMGGDDYKVEPPADDVERLRLVSAYWSTRAEMAAEDFQCVKYGRQGQRGVYSVHTLHNYDRLAPVAGRGLEDKLAALRWLAAEHQQCLLKGSDAADALQAAEGPANRAAEANKNDFDRYVAARQHELNRVQLCVAKQYDPLPTQPPLVPGTASSVTPTGQPAVA